VQHDGSTRMTLSDVSKSSAPRTGSPDAIEVIGLAAAYGGKRALADISFTVGSSEHVSLLGPSGCGKSTALRCIAGLETPVSGEIRIAGETVFSSSRGINLAPNKRHLAMVFQSYAIWPHMTVFENVAFGLRARKVRGAAVRERVEQALQLVGMSEFAQRPATMLSGGQQQRVALARCYASDSRAMLLDEPLSNLDARLRVKMREELKQLQFQSKRATLYVTHDLEEAMAMSDRIIVMRQGHIEQVGAPLAVYDKPRTEFVADFIGAANILSGVLQTDGNGKASLAVGDASVICATVDVPVKTRPDGRSIAAIRVVYPQLMRSAGAAGVNTWSASISSRTLLGDTVAYVVKWPGGDLRVQTSPSVMFEVNEEVQLHIPPERVVLIEPD
jgi:ABC-type Fe3+/spermidine/putrescine transport system ATPase subunit